MAYIADPCVDAYIDALPVWQQAICREIRDLVHAADPEVVETIKFTNRPYFVLSGNVCALLAAKDHVNVFLYDGAIVPIPDGIITGGHDDGPNRGGSPGRDDQRLSSDRDAPADRREQQSRRLAKAEARELRLVFRSYSRTDCNDLLRYWSW